MTHPRMFRAVVTVFQIAVAGLIVHAQSSITWYSGLKLNDLGLVGERLAAPQSTPSGAQLQLFRTIGVDVDETRVPRTCTEYLAAVGAGFGSRGRSGVFDEEPFARDCYLLRDLSSARPALVSHLPDWSYALLSILPPILQWGAKDEVANPGVSWFGSEDGLRGVSIASDTLEAEDDDTSYSLHLIGRGDFNGDGVADMAVFGQLRVKGASNTRNDYYVFTRCASTGLLIRITDPLPPFKLRGSCP